MEENLSKPQGDDVESVKKDLEDLAERLKAEFTYDPPPELVRKALCLFDPRLRKLVA